MRDKNWSLCPGGDGILVCERGQNSVPPLPRPGLLLSVSRMGWRVALSSGRSVGGDGALLCERSTVNRHGHKGDFLGV